MRVDNFRQYTLYNRALDLMCSIDQLINNGEWDLRDNSLRELTQTAIKIPQTIAYGIGQSNLKVRIKKFNEVKEQLIKLGQLLDCYDLQDGVSKVVLNEIEGNRIQVLKMLNAYFGMLKNKVI